MITNEALAILQNELTFTAGANRQYDDQYARSGAKIGDTLNVRKPPRYLGRTGSAVSLEDTTETSIPVVLTTQRGVDIDFTSKEMALSLDDYSNRILRPAVANVANGIDVDGVTLMTNSVYNNVGTPGTALTGGDLLVDAGSLLDENACPRGGNLRSAVFSPRSSGSVIKGLKSIFNDGKRISDQYNTGNLGPLYGFKTSMDQNVLNRTVGPLGGAPLVTGAGQTGSLLATDGWTAAAASRLKKGDVFTIAGVFAVNPQSRTSTNQLQQFVATADVSSDGTGAATIPIAPAITPTGAFQNVTNSPADNAAITVIGAAGTVTTQNLAYHRDAITLACADLPLPGGVDMAARKADPQNGLSIRIVRAYDVTTDRFITRLDILYGWAMLYPEWACRIQA